MLKLGAKDDFVCCQHMYSCH